MKKIKLLVISAILGTSLLATTNVFAAEGDVYDLSTKTVKYTRTQYLGDTNIYNTVVNETTVNSAGYGIEKSSNVYSIKKINDNIGTKIKAGNTIEDCMKSMTDGVTPEFTNNQTFSITSVAFTPNYLFNAGTLTLTVSDGTQVPVTGAVSVAGGANVTSYSVSGNVVTVVVDSYTTPTSATITIGGTPYTISGTSTNSNPTSTNTPTVSKINNISATVNQGSSYSLPSTVQATMSDSSSKSVSVTWDKQVDTSKSGTFTFNGTVNGYSGNVKLTLTVNASNNSTTTTPTISKLNDRGVTVNQGDSYTLPSTVQVTMSDGSTQQVSITWNNKSVDTSKVGSFSYYGTVNGYGGQVVFVVTVNASSVQQTSNGYFPLMSDVPQPNVNYFKYIKYTNNGSTLVYYYYNPNDLSSTFVTYYVNLLGANGWKYFDSKTNSDGTTSLFYYKGTNLIQLTTIGQYFTISGNVH